MSLLVIVEGLAGTWHYHLAPEEKFTRALCGAQTMRTSIPLAYWNKTPKDHHIPESWCSRCERLAAPGASNLKESKS